MKKNLCLAVLFLAAACATTGGPPRLSSEEYYRQAVQLVASRKYLAAKESLVEATNRYRSGDLDASLLELLGEVHFQLEEYEDVARVSDEFLRLHPRHPKAPAVRLRMGRAYLAMVRSTDRSQQNTQRALETFRRIQEYHPHTPEAAEAVPLAGQARDLLAESEILVAEFYRRRGNYAGAIGRLESVLRDYPGSGQEERALFLTGECFRLSQRPSQAAEYYTRLLERYPEGSYAGLARTQLRERSGS
jgi:outer membrane protein assembly factor BamD